MKTCHSCAHCSPGRRCTNPWSEDFNLVQSSTDVCPAWEGETDAKNKKVVGGNYAGDSIGGRLWDDIRPGHSVLRLIREVFR